MYINYNLKIQFCLKYDFMCYLNQQQGLKETGSAQTEDEWRRCSNVLNEWKKR